MKCDDWSTVLNNVKTYDFKKKGDNFYSKYYTKKVKIYHKSDKKIE